MGRNGNHNCSALIEMQFIMGMTGLSTRRALYFLLIHTSNLTASLQHKDH